MSVKVSLKWQVQTKMVKFLILCRHGIQRLFCGSIFGPHVYQISSGKVKLALGAEFQKFLLRCYVKSKPQIYKNAHNQWGFPPTHTCAHRVYAPEGGNHCPEHEIFMGHKSLIPSLVALSAYFLSSKLASYVFRQLNNFAAASYHAKTTTALIQPIRWSRVQ